MPYKKRIDSQESIQILFIARTYPPLVGGMERFASDFYRFMRELTPVKLIANPIGKRNLLFFFFKVMGYLILHGCKYDLVHFNDAILAPLVPIIRLFSSAKITFTVHGLDIVYRKFGYQQLVIPFLRHADRIFPVSQYTRTQCIQRGIPEDKCEVIPNGLDFTSVENCSEKIVKKPVSPLKEKLKQKTILLTLGRLIPRKGHAWFIKNVFTNLPDEYVYLIAGAGPETDNLENLIQAEGLHERVILLGYVTDQEKVRLLQTADLFIMPNIQDQNDQEGFGIVLLEAGRYGLPSVAADIEGIRDAVIHGLSGTLVPERDADAFITAIKDPVPSGKRITEILHEKFDWQVISQLYFQAFKDLTQ
jgi:glycosyltransferase involved in cell wall biosynthesis